MIKVGITGGIGSGKSIVCKIFSCLGIPVYKADDRAKYLMNNSPEIREKLTSKFGRKVFRDNQLNRVFLAELIFNDPNALDFVNSVVHPAVATDFEKWSRSYSSEPYIIEEAALLFESDSYKKMDKMVTVYSPLEVRIERVVMRDKVSREQVLSRIKNQSSDEEKLRRSDFVIYNDEKTSLIEQVLNLHKIFNPS